MDPLSDEFVAMLAEAWDEGYEMGGAVPDRFSRDDNPYRAILAAGGVPGDAPAEPTREDLIHNLRAVMDHADRLVDGRAGIWDEGWSACSAWWHSCAAGYSNTSLAINPYREGSADALAAVVPGDAGRAAVLGSAAAEDACTCSESVCIVHGDLDQQRAAATPTEEAGQP